MKLVVATNNPHKVKEFAEMLGGHFDSVQSLKQAGIMLDVEEDGQTFEENAIKKAEEAMQACGTAAMADDSGLCVDALGGDPGIYSARYAGEHGQDQANNDLVLANLQGVPMEKRTARFVCVLALARPNKPTLVVRGEAEGFIAFEEYGSGGFGYDPLFIGQDGRVFATLTPQEKHAVSHRGKAVLLLLRALEDEKKAE